MYVDLDEDRCKEGGGGVARNGWDPAGTARRSMLSSSEQVSSRWEQDEDQSTSGSDTEISDLWVLPQAPGPERGWQGSSPGAASATANGESLEDWERRATSLWGLCSMRWTASVSGSGTPTRHISTDYQDINFWQRLSSKVHHTQRPVLQYGHRCTQTDARGKGLRLNRHAAFSGPSRWVTDHRLCGSQITIDGTRVNLTDMGADEKLDLW